MRHVCERVRCTEAEGATAPAARDRNSAATGTVVGWRDFSYAPSTDIVPLCVAQFPRAHQLLSLSFPPLPLLFRRLSSTSATFFRWLHKLDQ
jgi:hypothetical protein